MSLGEELQQFYREARRMDPLFFTTVLLFSFIGNPPAGILQNQNFASVCMQTLFESVLRASMAHGMSIITSKALRHIYTGNAYSRGFVMLSLVVIHVIWITLTTICFTCQLSKVETAVSFLELATLLVIGAYVLRCAGIVLSKIWMNFNGAVNTQDESPSIGTGVLPNQEHGTTQPINQGLLLNSPNSNSSNYPISMPSRNAALSGVYDSYQTVPQNQLLNGPNSNPSIYTNNTQTRNDPSCPVHGTSKTGAQNSLYNDPNSNTNICTTNRQPSNAGSHGADSGESASSSVPEGVSPISGIRYCRHHAPPRSPVTTLRNMDSSASSHQAEPNTSHQRIKAASPNEGPSLIPEGETLNFEHKTRRGTVYNRMSLS